MTKPQHVADLAAYFSKQALARENAISDHEAGTMRLLERTILRGKTVVINLKIEGLAPLSSTINPTKAQAAKIIERVTGTNDYVEFTAFNLMEYRTLSGFIQSCHIRQKRAGNIHPQSNTYIRHRGIVRPAADTLLDQNPKRIKRFLTEHAAGLPHRPHIFLFQFEEETDRTGTDGNRTWVTPPVTITSLSGPKETLRFKVIVADRDMNDLFERGQENGDYIPLVSIITNESLSKALASRQTSEDMAEMTIPLVSQTQMHLPVKNPYEVYVYPEGSRPVMRRRKKTLWRLS